ncbi:MAG: hypothetical protein MJY93_05090 [Fibrobacter sp.]|nr:hypothetical protein [Fibrobacter sp.]
MTALLKKRSKFITAALVILACATSSFAELRSMQFTPEESANDSWKAYLGFSGGNSMIADDGTIFAGLRIGIDWNSLIGTGLWGNVIISDVRNYNVKQKQMLDYKAFGVQGEITPYRHGIFSVSVPVNVGFGVVNTMNQGDEAFSPEDYFFVADASVHFGARLTKALEVSIGGGYRIFAGIEENNLENSDFNTLFGELRFTIKE